MAFWDKFFNDTKASEAGSLIAGFNLNRPVYRSKLNEKREAYAKEAFMGVIAYSAVTSVSEAVSRVPWQLFTGTGSDRTEIEDHPILTLLNRPNPGQSGIQFRENWAQQYLLHGEAWQERVMLNMSPEELYVHPADKMAPIPGPFGFPKAYEFKADDGQKRVWQADPATGLADIRLTKKANPADHWRGFAPTQAASVSIDQFNAGQQWNAALLQNAAEPSGALVYNPKEGPGQLTEEQREQLLGSLRERYSGARNAGAPMLLEGAMSWEQFGMGPREMDWLEGQREAARMISLAYGVPPQLLGIPGDNTYSNYREARLAFYDDTVLPILDTMRDEWNHWLLPAFGNEKLKLDYDDDTIEALDFRREREWDRVKNADFLSIDEKRAVVGYDALGPEGGGDIIEAVERGAGMVNAGINDKTTD